MISTSVMDLLDQIAALETSTDFSSLPFGEYLSRIEIDWLELKNSLSLWLKQLGNAAVDNVGNIIGDVASVCGNTFHMFIAGQTTEAIILGTLCTIGILILRLPYALLKDANDKQEARNELPKKVEQKAGRETDC